MRPAVNQGKLGAIIRTSRRKHAIRTHPQVEKIRMDVNEERLSAILRTCRERHGVKSRPKVEKMDFNQLVKRVRKLLCDYYLYGFDMEGPATEKEYRVAVTKEFVKRAYEMVDVKNKWDRIAYNWAHRPGFSEDWGKDASISFSHATGRLFEKLEEEAPYAIQNIFDECYYFGRGFLAGLMFEAFDRNPEADLEIVRRNMVRYIKLAEMAEPAYTTFDLWDIIGCNTDSTLERALDEKVEQLNHGDAKQREEAWEYLRHFGYKRENE